MPVRVVESLEAEDWARLGAPVFIRGQLRSYSRLLGLVTESVHVASGVAPVEPAKLVPRTFVPPMQRLAEQIARRAVYVVITAAIAVPVWLATRPHLEVQEQESASLDVPGPLEAAVPGRVPAQTVERAPSASAPIVASMTPVPQRPRRRAEIALRLSGDSWVQVVAQDGRTIEESLLRAGDQRSYPRADVGRLVIGNAGAAEVTVDGRVQDLSNLQRANVARFTVSSDGALVPDAR
jgi:cytoskeleton protein RodZ